MPTRNKPPPDRGATRAKALRALARREHSAAELTRRLQWGGAEAETAREVVGEFTREGWQSDERFAELVVRSRIERGFGPLRIEAELLAAGVSEGIVAAALEQAAEDWRARAREAHARRFAGPAGDAREWQKRYRFLAQRGFAAEDIHAVLKEPPG